MNKQLQEKDSIIEQLELLIRRKEIEEAKLRLGLQFDEESKSELSQSGE
jgi:hypothetical protein